MLYISKTEMEHFFVDKYEERRYTVTTNFNKYILLKKSDMGGQLSEKIC